MRALLRCLWLVIIPMLIVGCGELGEENVPPEIDMLTIPEKAEVGEQITFQVMAHDPDADVLSYLWIVDGAALGTTTPQVTWTPHDTEGEVTVEVHISDGVNEPVVQRKALLIGVQPNPDSSVIPPSPRQVLVDASRDGGAWWFPQGSQFDPGRPHQGQALVTFLDSMGFVVQELPRPTAITSDLLAPFELVIRANESGGYSSAEINAYHDYVMGGGKILLLSDFIRPGQQDSLASSFGIRFEGISRGENVVNRLEPHSITQSISVLSYQGIGSGITEFPETATMLGYLSAGTYLDLNDNQRRDEGEPVGVPVVGAMPLGDGHIVFCGETNLWLMVPQPLLENTINWLTQDSAR